MNTPSERSIRLVFDRIHSFANSGVEKISILNRAPTLVRLRESSTGSTYSSLYSHTTRRVSFFTPWTISHVYLSSDITESFIFVSPASVQSPNWFERKNPHVYTQLSVVCPSGEYGELIRSGLYVQISVFMGDFMLFNIKTIIKHL